MNVLSNANDKPKWLIVGGLILLISLFFIVQHIFVPEKISNATIDQLVMQATYGHDESSLQRLKSAAENGQIEAQLALGKALLFKSESVQAVNWLSTAAQAGNAEAETQLGKFYFSGSEHGIKNYALAMHWFNLAAAQKNPVAAYYLGLMYKNGYGTQIQPEKAVAYFDLAANHQIPSAMFMLANAYQFGDGVNVDLKKALHWHEAAADLELPEAIQELAHIYQYGNAVVKADQTAYQQQLLEIGHSLKHPAINP